MGQCEPIEGTIFMGHHNPGLILSRFSGSQKFNSVGPQRIGQTQAKDTKGRKYLVFCVPIKTSCWHFFPLGFRYEPGGQRLEKIWVTHRELHWNLCVLFVKGLVPQSKHVHMDGKFPEGHRVTRVYGTRVSLFFLQFSRCLPKRMNYCLTKLIQII